MIRKAIARVLGFVVLAGTAFACSSNDFVDSPGDLAGVYSINITNGKNDCQFQKWTVGDSTNAIPFDVKQSGADITGTIGGAAGIYLNLIAGTDTLLGSMSTSTFTMKALSKEYTDAGCVYKIQIKADGKLTSNSIDGTLTYTNIISSGGAACGVRSTCSSVQSFAGSRPPK